MEEGERGGRGSKPGRPGGSDRFLDQEEILRKNVLGSGRMRPGQDRSQGQDNLLVPQPGDFGPEVNFGTGENNR